MGISARHAPALDLPARFMALGMGSFALAMLTAPVSLSLTQGYFNDFKLLALVHLVTLGFIGSMIIGASYQLVPVVLQTQLASVPVGRLSFWFYSIGLAIFLGGLFRPWIPALGVGGTLLGIAFLLYSGNVFVTWWRAPYREVVGWHVVAGLLGSLMGMSMGVVLAFNKGNGMLGQNLLGFLGGHIAFMMGGWVAITLTGVAYRLVCMFTLSEKHFRPWLAWLEFGLVVGGSWLIANALHLEWPAVWNQVGAVMLLAGFACFVTQLWRLYQRRLRKVVDIHMPFAVASGVMLLAVPVLVFIGFWREALPNHSIWVAVIFLALLGAVGTAIQGFFYKISTFLVWLKRYAPVAGKGKTPKLEDMYDRRLAMVGCAVWVASVVAGTVVLLAGITPIWPVGVGLLAGAACFLTNVAMIARHWWRGPRLSVREPVIPHAPHLARRSPS